MVYLTIVTPSFNHGDFIDRAIDSVTARDSHAVEHIVVDGGSQDGTLETLSRRGIDRRVCPGLTSHQAINLGIGEAKGEIIGVLNTDDCYEPGGLDEIIAFFRSHPGVDVVCGGMRFFEEEIPGAERELARRGHLSGDAMLLELTFGAPGFNSWFFRRNLLERLGELDPAWDFAADRDLLLRLMRCTRPTVLDRLIYHYRVHGRSRTMRPDRNNLRAITAEHVRLAQCHLPFWANHPTAGKILAAWWSFEWLKLKILGGSPEPCGPPPPLSALPRAWMLRRQLHRSLP